MIFYLHMRQRLRLSAVQSRLILQDTCALIKHFLPARVFKEDFAKQRIRVSVNLRNLCLQDSHV